MFSLFASRRQVPDSISSCLPEGPIRTDEARLAAWALALGEIRPSTDPPLHRKPHRAGLPDIDWANAVPMAPRRTMLRLLVAALATRLLPVASIGDTAPRSIGTKTVPDDAGASVASAIIWRRQSRKVVGLVGQPKSRAA